MFANKWLGWTMILIGYHSWDSLYSWTNQYSIACFLPVFFPFFDRRDSPAVSTHKYRHSWGFFRRSFWSQSGFGETVSWFHFQVGWKLDTRWGPYNRYKWGYNSFKWPCKWVPGVIQPYLHELFHPIWQNWWLWAHLVVPMGGFGWGTPASGDLNCWTLLILLWANCSHI